MKQSTHRLVGALSCIAVLATPYHCADGAAPPVENRVSHRNLHACIRPKWRPGAGALLRFAPLGESFVFFVETVEARDY